MTRRAMQGFLAGLFLLYVAGTAAFFMGLSTVRTAPKPPTPDGVPRPPVVGTADDRYARCMRPVGVLAAKCEYAKTNAECQRWMTAVRACHALRKDAP